MFRSFIPTALNHWRGERGTVLPLVAISMVTLTGMMGLGIDVGAMYRHRRIMQTAADAGALAGASEIYRLQNTRVATSARSATASNRFTNGVEDVTVTVNRPPASGFYAGNSQYVEVLVSQPSPTFFMQVLGWDSTTVTARAVAGVGANGQNCVYVLDPSMDDAFHAASSAVLNADCGVIVNSNSSRAMRTSSSASVTASNVSVTGNYRIDGGNITPTPNVGVPPEPDPLAYLQPPAYGACDQTNFHVSSGTITVSPGVYCKGMKIVNNAHVILSPGMYVLRGGGLDLQSNAIIEGTGVTFFLTAGPGYPYGTISFQSSCQVRLKAPTTGPYAGILFYQDPNAGHPNHVHHMESSSSSYMEGALYFPTQVVRLHSSTTLDARYTQVVARSVDMQSSAHFRVRADYSGLPGGSPIKRISLVE